MIGNSTENPWWRRFHKVQQRLGSSVLEYVSEMEVLLSKCAYRQDIGEALAKDRLIVGLQSQDTRDRLGAMLDQHWPQGVSYEWLRFQAIRLDGGDPGYAEPPLRPAYCNDNRPPPRYPEPERQPEQRQPPPQQRWVCQNGSEQPRGPYTEAAQRPQRPFQERLPPAENAPLQRHDPWAPWAHQREGHGRAQQPAQPWHGGQQHQGAREPDALHQTNGWPAGQPGPGQPGPARPADWREGHIPQADFYEERARAPHLQQNPWREEHRTGPAAVYEEQTMMAQVRRQQRPWLEQHGPGANGYQENRMAHQDRRQPNPWHEEHGTGVYEEQNMMRRQINPWIDQRQEHANRTCFTAPRSNGNGLGHQTSNARPPAGNGWFG